MEKRVLILSGIPWDATIQRHHHMAWFFKKMGYEVVFIEKIPSSKFTIKKLINRIIKIYDSKSNSVKVDKDTIKVINPKLVNPMGSLFKLINKYKINKLILEIGKEFDIVINYLPINTTYYLINNINSKIKIYDCVRDFENWGGYPKNISEFEREIILMSNLILTDSYYLTNKIKKKYNVLNVHQMLPTVSEKQLSIFRKCQLKDKIKDILYFGTVGSHVDVNILNNLITDGFNVHIIGEIEKGISLNEKIIYHGFISSIDLLAEYVVKYADAIIIPYKGNMDGVIPAKLMQCMATGLPIFINNFYDTNALRSYLYVYDTYEELLELISNYNLKNHKKIAEEMIKFSEQNITENQYNNLKSLIELYKNEDDLS